MNIVVLVLQQQVNMVLRYHIFNKDLRTSKPKTYANKVGMVLTHEVNAGLRIKQTTSI